MDGIQQLQRMHVYLEMVVCETQTVRLLNENHNQSKEPEPVPAAFIHRLTLLWGKPNLKLPHAVLHGMQH